MKKYSRVPSIGFFILAVAFTGCSEDSGGSGAEFDPSQYYTKTEVDTLMSSVVTNESAAAQAIAANDLAGGTSPGWPAPAGAKGALMELLITNNSSVDITTYIEVSSSDGSYAHMGTSITVPNDGVYYSKIFYVPVAGGTTIVAYHPESAHHAGITDLTTVSGFEIYVKPIAWFK